MRLNKEESYFEDQAITTATTYNSDTVDHGGAEVALWAPIFVQVTETFVGGTSLVIVLQTDSTTTITPDEVLYTSETILTATLVAGYRFRLCNIPEGILRYSRLAATSVGVHTAGKISAYVGSLVNTNKP